MSISSEDVTKDKLMAAVGAYRSGRGAAGGGTGDGRGAGGGGGRAGEGVKKLAGASVPVNVGAIELEVKNDK